MRSQGQTQQQQYKTTREKETAWKGLKIDKQQQINNLVNFVPDQGTSINI